MNKKATEYITEVYDFLNGGPIIIGFVATLLITILAVIVAKLPFIVGLIIVMALFLGTLTGIKLVIIKIKKLSKETKDE
jgi:hypothetical protein